MHQAQQVLELIRRGREIKDIGLTQSCRNEEAGSVRPPDMLGIPQLIGERES